MASRTPAAARPLRLWPLLVVVVGVLVGLAITMLVDQGWRLGCIVIGVSLLVGATVRLILPPNAAGLLQVRGKTFDVAVLAVAGAAVLVLTLVVPAGS